MPGTRQAILIAIAFILAYACIDDPKGRPRPRFTGATYVDVNGNRLIDSPDVIRVTFTHEVLFQSATPAKDAFELSENPGETLGSSYLLRGSSGEEIRIMLEADASFQPTGLYNLAPGATGIHLIPGQTAIVREKNGRPVYGSYYPRDLGGDLLSRVTDVVYADTNLSGVIDAGDVVEVAFFPPVDLFVSATPDSAFHLPVAGDTFGAGAALSSPGGTNLTSVDVFLGVNPVLEPSGLFDPGVLSPGASSGIDVSGSPEVSQTIGGAVVDPLTPAGVDIR